jgi:hypothetical protein
MPLAPRISEEERAAHRSLLEKLGVAAIWNLYSGKKAGA